MTMPQNHGKIGCGTAVVFGVVALILLPAACLAMGDAPDLYVPPPVVHHDTVIVVPQPAPAPAPAPKARPSVRMRPGRPVAPGFRKK